MKYAVVYERTGTGYSAYVPDLPGCIATGRTLDLTKKRMEKAMEMHLSAMSADGDRIPEPTTVADHIKVPNYTLARSSGHHKRPRILEKISGSAEHK
jgi:predicted RNase H-like HicB family nuclease